ncbi:MAG TPA: hypothetical protein VHC69_10290, partial [Polyangiaceae bacterium]|nr:hypothetical protein [Polyangiaceae bacterium]
LATPPAAAPPLDAVTPPFALASPPALGAPPVLALASPPALAPPVPSAAALSDDPPHAERDKQTNPTVADLMNTLRFSSGA